MTRSSLRDSPENVELVAAVRDSYTCSYSWTCTICPHIGSAPRLSGTGDKRSRAPVALRVAMSALFAAALALVPAVGGAQAPATAVPGEVLIILAADVPGVVDPRLANVPALRRAPFNTYRSMALLSSPRIRLRVGQAEEVALPNGRRIRIVLREVTERGRYRIQLSINRPGQQDYLPEMSVVASPGDPFFIAGQSFQAGTLVIGIRLGGASS